MYQCCRYVLFAIIASNAVLLIIYVNVLFHKQHLSKAGFHPAKYFHPDAKITYQEYVSSLMSKVVKCNFECNVNYTLVIGGPGKVEDNYTIYYQTEQPGNKSWMTREELSRMDRTIAVWDFSFKKFGII